jgi:cholesterol transport system auxiliary component
VKKHTIGILITVLALIALVGCAGKVRYPAYYTFNLPSPPDPPAPEGTRATLAVREFRSPIYLRQGPIVYRTSPEQIGFYDYHRWAVDPREFLTNAVIERLRASGRFAQVRAYDGHSDMEYVLSGRLEKLEEVDNSGGIKVEVAISAQMTNSASGATIWSNEVSETGTVEGRDVPAVVSAMNRTMDHAIDKLLTTPLIPAASNSK